MNLRKEIGRIVVNGIYNFDCYVKKKYNGIIGHEYINRPMTDEQYRDLATRLYGNSYIEDKYIQDQDAQMQLKNWFVDIIMDVISIRNVCDAGANRGYLMKAFFEHGIEAYGFDILDSLDVVLPEVRSNYKLGSILSIPDFDIRFDLVTSMDVFEHIPINKIPQMVNELKQLKPKYFCFMISKDMMNDGHICLKNTRWWIKHFSPEYRIMKELTPKLNAVITRGGVKYRYTGIPRNGFNQVPGIVFMEKMNFENN